MTDWKVCNSHAQTSEGGIIHPPSDVYSEAFSVPFYTLIKLCYTKALEGSILFPGPKAKSFLEITNLANISCRDSFGYLPRSITAWSFGSPIFLRTLYTLFPRGSTIFTIPPTVHKCHISSHLINTHHFLICWRVAILISIIFQPCQGFFSF